MISTRLATLEYVWPRPHEVGRGRLDPDRLTAAEQAELVEIEAELAVNGYAALSAGELMRAAELAATMRKDGRWSPHPNEPKPTSCSTWRIVRLSCAGPILN